MKRCEEGGGGVRGSAPLLADHSFELVRDAGMLGGPHHLSRILRGAIKNLQRGLISRDTNFSGAVASKGRLELQDAARRHDAWHRGADERMEVVVIGKQPRKQEETFSGGLMLGWR